LDRFRPFEYSADPITEHPITGNAQNPNKSMFGIGTAFMARIPNKTEFPSFLVQISSHGSNSEPFLIPTRCHDPKSERVGNQTRAVLD
jgi:hypothetical protein